MYKSILKIKKGSLIWLFHGYELKKNKKNQNDLLKCHKIQDFRFGIKKGLCYLNKNPRTPQEPVERSGSQRNLEEAFAHLEVTIPEMVKTITFFLNKFFILFCKYMRFVEFKNNYKRLMQTQTWLIQLLLSFSSFTFD